MHEVKMASSAPVPSGQAAKSEPKNISGLQHNVALGYLRAFIIVLVVAYHAVIVFHLIAPHFQLLHWSLSPGCGQPFLLLMVSTR